MPNKWVTFVKAWSAKNKMSYGCAISNPDLKIDYYRAHPKKTSVVKQIKAIASKVRAKTGQPRLTILEKPDDDNKLIKSLSKKTRADKKVILEEPDEDVPKKKTKSAEDTEYTKTKKVEGLKLYLDRPTGRRFYSTHGDKDPIYGKIDGKWYIVGKVSKDGRGADFSKDKIAVPKYTFFDRDKVNITETAKDTEEPKPEPKKEEPKPEPKKAQFLMDRPFALVKEFLGVKKVDMFNGLKTVTDVAVFFWVLNELGYASTEKPYLLDEYKDSEYVTIMNRSTGTLMKYDGSDVTASLPRVGKVLGKILTGDWGANPYRNAGAMRKHNISIQVYWRGDGKKPRGPSAREISWGEDVAKYVTPINENSKELATKYIAQIRADSARHKEMLSASRSLAADKIKLTLSNSSLINVFRALKKKLGKPVSIPTSYKDFSVADLYGKFRKFLKEPSIRKQFDEMIAEQTLIEDAKKAEQDAKKAEQDAKKAEQAAKKAEPKKTKKKLVLKQEEPKSSAAQKVFGNKDLMGMVKGFTNEFSSAELKRLKKAYGPEYNFKRDKFGNIVSYYQHIGDARVVEIKSTGKYYNFTKDDDDILAKKPAHPEFKEYAKWLKASRAYYTEFFNKYGSKSSSASAQKELKTALIIIANKYLFS